MATSCTLGIDGCVIYPDTKQFRTLTKELTLKHFIRVTRTHTVTKLLPVYKKEPRGFIIPRGFAAKSFEMRANNMNFGSAEFHAAIAAIYDNSTMQLDENQQVILNYLLTNYFTPERISSGAGTCILQLDTGLGKSYLAAALMRRFAVKTLIIAPKKSIINEWIEIFKTYFPGLAVGSSCGKLLIDGQVIMTTVKSAYKQPPLFYADFQFVIIDEVHNIATEKYGEILWNSNVPMVLGLTATPNDRLDGFDNYYKLHLGDVVQARDVTGFNAANVQFKGQVRAIKYRGSGKYIISEKNKKTGTTNVMKMLKTIESDPHRTKLVLGIMHDLYTEGHNTFVFAENVDYLNELYNAFASAHEHTFILTGGVATERYLAAKVSARTVLTTYGYSIEGVSFKHMDAILFATPRKSKMMQILGRIIRRDGDQTVTRKIVDIVDANTFLSKQFPLRRCAYDNKGYRLDIAEATSG